MRVIIRIAIKDNTWEEPFISNTIQVGINDEYVSVILEDGTKITYNKKYVVSIKEYKK